MENNKLIVTEAHLYQAIKETEDLESIPVSSRDNETGGFSSRCILAVAARQLTDVKRCGYHTFGNANVGYFVEPEDDCINMVQLFDDKQYEEVRQLLPLTFTYVQGKRPTIFGDNLAQSLPDDNGRKIKRNGTNSTKH
jgi:hypothetical protein